MRQPSYAGQFKHDLTQLEKRGKEIDKLKRLLHLLIAGESLPKEFLDHPLKRRLTRFQGCPY